MRYFRSAFSLLLVFVCLGLPNLWRSDVCERHGRYGNILPVISAISRSLFNTFNLHQQYVAASFCPKINYKNGKLACPVGNCPLVQQAMTTIVAGVQYVQYYGPISRSRHNANTHVEKLSTLGNYWLCGG